MPHDNDPIDYSDVKALQKELQSDDHQRFLKAGRLRTIQRALRENDIHQLQRGLRERNPERLREAFEGTDPKKAFSALIDNDPARSGCADEGFRADRLLRLLQTEEVDPDKDLDRLRKLLALANQEELQAIATGQVTDRKRIREDLLKKDPVRMAQGKRKAETELTPDLRTMLERCRTGSDPILNALEGVNLFPEEVAKRILDRIVACESLRSVPEKLRAFYEKHSRLAYFALVPETELFMQRWVEGKTGTDHQVTVGKAASQGFRSLQRMASEGYFRETAEGEKDKGMNILNLFHNIVRNIYIKLSKDAPSMQLLPDGGGNAMLWARFEQKLTNLKELLGPDRYEVFRQIIANKLVIDGTLHFDRFTQEELDAIRDLLEIDPDEILLDDDVKLDVQQLIEDCQDSLRRLSDETSDEEEEVDPKVPESEE